VVRNSVVDWGPKPFRNFDVWQHEVGFKEVVKHAWDQDVGNGNNLELVKLKLKGVKKEVKSWYAEVFNCENMKKQQIINEIEVLDKCDNGGNLQEDMRIRRIQLLGDLRCMSERDNAMLRQKSRVQWLEKGDLNSKFFHSKLRWRRLNNDIKGFVLDGEWCEDPHRVKNAMREHFEIRFGAQPKLGLNLDGVQFRCLSNEDNEVLCCKFNDTEILMR